MLASLLALGEQAWPASRSGNVYSLRPSDGWGEVEWISQSSFRWTRGWGRRPERRAPIKDKLVEVSRKDLGDRWRFTTDYVVLEVDKAGLKFSVTNDEGEPLVEATGVRRTPNGVELEFPLAASERLYGMGQRTAETLDVRGQVIRTKKPFLMSSAGYGEYYRGGKEYEFDLGRSRAGQRVVAILGSESVDYYFYYGPSPKEILEEHVALGAPGADLNSKDFEVLEAGQVRGDVARLPGPAEASWSGLRESMYALMHAGFSAMLSAALDLGPYLGVEGELEERAAQLGSFAPVVWVSRPGARSGVGAKVAETRKRLTPYLVCYAQEARENGYPMARPLAMQFHTDSEGWKWPDEFMLGDELLVAPVSAPGGRRSVYFPRGIWTNWRTNRVYKGRQAVEIEAARDELPVFARNGSIVPVAGVRAEEPLGLHYFPKLAAEFLILEEDLGDYTLLHAAPAADVVRLEAESLKDREYEWVVHHTGPCKRVAQVDGPEYGEAKSLGELRPGWWYYDRAADNLHVRMRTKAGQDHIVNVWLEAVWN